MIFLFKIDHIIFKSKAYKIMIENLKDESLSDYTSCKLGSWYINEGKKQFSFAPSYEKIKEPHYTVHTLAIKNIQFIKNGDKRVENEEVIVNNFKKMEEESHKLFEILDQLNKEIKKSTKR